MTLLDKVAEPVSVEVAGLLARPLYLCTGKSKLVKLGLCISVASMSRFVQQGAGRQQYLCAKCKTTQRKYQSLTI